MTEKLKKDDTVFSKHLDSFESYVEVDNEDNFIDICDVANGTQKAVMVHQSCELKGIWLWDDSFPETLEEFVEKLYNENLLEN